MLSPWCVLLAWLIALAALLGSLYSTYVLHYPVCDLCWFQRIFMYPLVILIGMDAFTMETTGIKYCLPFPILGSLFAIYQYLEQMIPGFQPIQFCSPDVQCSTIHIQWMGFITYPFLSLMAFFTIFILLIVAKKGSAAS